MTAADRYAQPRPRADGDTVVFRRVDILNIIRAQTVVLNAFRATLGLGPVPTPGRRGQAAAGETGGEGVESGV